MCLAVTVAVAQRYYGRGWDSDQSRTAREVGQHAAETPSWTNAPGFEQDVFTFARIRYDRGGYGGRGGWATDLPDSDLNLSYRLQQMTSMKVDPDGRLLRLTDKDLVNYPFIYIVEPGGLWLSDEEVVALRRYLQNGGFLWFDDFWGEREWENVAIEMIKVFTNRTFVELPLSHPLYSCVYPIKAKTQVPDVGRGTASQWTGVTWERPDAQEVHHRAIFDDQGRIMVFATHNTDNGDGWEWEGDNQYYFREFSEKTAYPLAINVLFYVMTH
jgi:hypothetical protein